MVCKKAASFLRCDAQSYRGDNILSVAYFPSSESLCLLFAEDCLCRPWSARVRCLGGRPHWCVLLLSLHVFTFASCHLAGPAHVPAACNTYVRLDMDRWFDR